jgi:L-lysine exporter family protein LysE/ArgO
LLTLISGFLSGLSLIVAIGAQNAFVIKQGLRREYVLLIVLICSISDALLIFLGSAGLGQIIQSLPELLEVVRWFGVVYLLWFGVKSVKSAFTNQSLKASEGQLSSKKMVITTMLALTFLNPHVYLDTVILLGSIANQFENQRWLFSTGAALGSFVWFFSIGYGAKAASRFMSKPIFWKVLDLGIAAIMFSIAIFLALFNF